MRLNQSKRKKKKNNFVPLSFPIHSMNNRNGKWNCMKLFAMMDGNPQDNKGEHLIFSPFLWISHFFSCRCPIDRRERTLIELLSGEGASEKVYLFYWRPDHRSGRFAEIETELCEKEKTVEQKMNRLVSFVRRSNASNLFSATRWRTILFNFIFGPTVRRPYCDWDNTKRKL